MTKIKHVRAFYCPECTTENDIEFLDPDNGEVFDIVVKCVGCTSSWIVEFFMEDSPEIVDIKNGKYYSRNVK